MGKKFRVLRIIGTIWKILAWIVLILGIVGAFASLLLAILGGEMMRGWMGNYGPMRGVGPGLGGVLGGIVTFIVTLILTAIYFLMLYAVGDMIYLLLDIEENTRMTAQWAAHLAPQAYTPAPPVYTPPPPTYPTPPPSYPTPPPGQF